MHQIVDMEEDDTTKHFAIGEITQERETTYARAQERSTKIGSLIRNRKQARLHARCPDNIDENGLAMVEHFNFARETQQSINDTNQSNGTFFLSLF